MHGTLVCVGTQALKMGESQVSDAKDMVRVICNTSISQAVIQQRKRLYGFTYTCHKLCQCACKNAKSMYSPFHAIMQVCIFAIFQQDKC